MKGEGVYAYIVVKESAMEMSEEEQQQMKNELKLMVKKKISGCAVPELIQVWKQKETDCPIYLEWLTINAECSSILFLVTAEGAIAICFLKWAITDLFFRLFLVFSNKQYIVYNKCGQCQYSISCSNSNPRLLEHESPPITRPRPVFSP